MAGHTPTPWKANSDNVYAGRDRVAVCESVLFSCAVDEANAAFIVQACNAHDDLVDALSEVMEWIGNWDPAFLQDDEWPATRARVNAALAKARAQTP